MVLKCELIVKNNLDIILFIYKAKL